MGALVKSSSAFNSMLSCLRSAVPRTLLPASCQLHTSPPLLNANRTCTGRSGRATYLRTYPVLLVQPDGSTITINYKEPRRVLTMPIDITTLSEQERKARQKLRDGAKKDKAKKVSETFTGDSLDQYKKFWKKK
ncbi:large ribosomal subunit protein mL55 [Hyperolius riggenbachi]|uniref:large ribosomal subunit protein mL55 n=1 Tax=Hyperolius riggenbachi TaxID=752182 RepID=UPI0035A27750